MEREEKRESLDPYKQQRLYGAMGPLESSSQHPCTWKVAPSFTHAALHMKWNLADYRQFRILRLIVWNLTGNKSNKQTKSRAVIVKSLLFFFQPEIIVYRGYPVELHQILTEDGYILGTFLLFTVVAPSLVTFLASDFAILSFFPYCVTERL